MVTIKVMQNGPYLVQGDDVSAVDWKDAAYATPKRPFALCRCGASVNKPFCDGMHSKVGFKADAAAAPRNAEPRAIEGSQSGLSDITDDDLRFSG
jgi:3-phenylpropionate/trans-cinnamate dioxygenase ferredoxin subunit